MTKDNSPINQINNEEKSHVIDEMSESLENTNNADMPTILGDEWLSLAQDWQTQPFEKTDIQALVKQTKRRIFWAKTLLALDVIATICMFIAFFIGIYQGDWKNATIAYVGVGGLFSAIFVYYEIKIRWQTWQHSCDSPDKAIANAINGCKSSIKYVLLIKYSTWFMLPFVNAYLFAIINESGKSPWPSFLTINLIIIAMWGIGHFFHLKRKKELQKLLAL